MDVVGAGASTASTSHPSYLPRPSSSRPSGREGAIERGLARSGVTAPLLQADSVEGRYLSAVRTCNEGQLGSRTACEVFAGAALQGMSRDRDVTRMWGMLREMATSMKKGSAGGSNKAVLALASGARRFLEKEHMAFVEKVRQGFLEMRMASVGRGRPRGQPHESTSEVVPAFSCRGATPTSRLGSDCST